MSRPLLLDLFCGAGGAASGYHDAGFDIIGVDIKPQPNYPYEFHQRDAISAFATLLDIFQPAAVHASPPCQAYANVTSWRGSTEDHPDLLPATREMLNGTGVPWVIENVPEAPIRPDLLLCGSQFGLRVKRHRAFETSQRLFTLMPACHHHRLLPFMHKGERAFADAMGCDWMTNREARQAIPPAYTRFIGEQMLAAIGVTA